MIKVFPSVEKGRLLINVVLVLLCGGVTILSLSCYSSNELQEPLATSEQQGQISQVLTVPSAQRLVLSNGEEVHLAGVSLYDDETQRNLAREFLSKLVLNKTVRLEWAKQGERASHKNNVFVFMDLQEQNGEPLTLPVGFETLHEELFVNATMIRAGFARWDAEEPSVPYQKNLQSAADQLAKDRQNISQLIRQ